MTDEKANQYSIQIEYPESTGVTCDNPLWLNAKGYHSSEDAVRKFYKAVVDAGIFKILKVKKLEN